MFEMRFIIMVLVLTASCHKKTKAPIGPVIQGGDVVSYSALTPATNTVEINELSVQTGSVPELVGNEDGLFVYKEQTSGLDLEYEVYSVPQKGYGTEVWSKSFDFASRKIKLLTPAIYSDSDSLFIKGVRGDCEVFLVTDKNYNNVRGLLGSRGRESGFTLFRCKGVLVDSDLNKLMTIVSSFFDRLNK